MMRWESIMGEEVGLPNFSHIPTTLSPIHSYGCILVFFTKFLDKPSCKSSECDLPTSSYVIGNTFFRKENEEYQSLSSQFRIPPTFRTNIYCEWKLGLALLTDDFHII